MGQSTWGWQRFRLTNRNLKIQGKMLFSSSILLFGCISVLADGDADCCEHKHVSGLGPASDGDYYLVENRENRLPDLCRDGCVYTKDGSGNTEYCFKSSSVNATTCEFDNCRINGLCTKNTITATCCKVTACRCNTNGNLSTTCNGIAIGAGYTCPSPTTTGPDVPLRL